MNEQESQMPEDERVENTSSTVGDVVLTSRKRHLTQPGEWVRRKEKWT
jgi:hypothetical protein